MIINATPDKEKVKSILNLAKSREHFISSVNIKEFSTIAAENYYEIIKEIITALMAVDGYKTLSHEVLVGYLDEFFPKFPESEILFIDQLRKLRNNIAYKGFFIAPDFLERNESRIKEIISKLKRTLENKLKLA